MRTSSRSEQQALHRALAAYVDDVASLDDSRQIQLLGTGAVAELEGKLCKLVGMKYCVCVSSATTGLMVAGLALGLSNRAFVTTPLSYAAALAGWLAIGARPVFADVEDRVTAVAHRGVEGDAQGGLTGRHGLPRVERHAREASGRRPEGLPMALFSVAGVGRRRPGRRSPAERRRRDVQVLCVQPDRAARAIETQADVDGATKARLSRDDGEVDVVAERVHIGRQTQASRQWLGIGGGSDGLVRDRCRRRRRGSAG